MKPLSDTLSRPLANLRISVTDRCNLRCAYCMPEQDYVWLARESLLSFEEISAVVGVFAGLGVDKVRLTGGEPLLRRDLERLVAMIAAKPAIRDFALTTNGLLLAEQAQRLRQAGLHRITVSLDTLVPEVFERLTRRTGLERVIEGIDAAREAGFARVKLDTVVIRGTNEGEIVDLVEFAKSRDAELRLIEYMDVGGATRWRPEDVVSRREMLGVLEQAYGPVQPLFEASSAPAERFLLPDGTVVGIIASTTAPFCRSCDRSRLTADGMWYLCLYARTGLDLRGPLRAGASEEELRARIAAAWSARADRGAEDRLAAQRVETLVQIEDLRRDPHLEMHTRGG